MSKILPKKTKVLVCLSGGVDSSVTAALLVRAGYQVTAAFMINYDNDGDPNCWRHDYRDAVRVAAHLGIPIVRWNFTKEYKRDVLSYMYREYAAGRTPNPDVLCNQFVKFGAWLKKAQSLGFDYLATGHYANTRNGQLLTAKDTHKDQTYFLHQLSKEQLAHTLFPIGSYTKPQVRALAKKFKLPTALRAESMGICFVGEVPMKEFLEKEIKHNPGIIVHADSGKNIGTHDGLAFYTIGQRQHLTTSAGQTEAWYVVDKNQETNTLIIGPKDSPGLWKTKITLEKTHWISGQTPQFPLQCKVRLRHGQTLRSATITSVNNQTIVTFVEPEWGVTPGQFTVFYHHNFCLGGGIIT